MTMLRPKLKTEKSVTKQAFEAAVYTDYLKYASNPEQSMVKLREFIMQKHNIKCLSTYYAIIRRQSAKL